MIEIFRPKDVIPGYPSFYQSMDMSKLHWSGISSVHKADLIIYKDGYDINVLKFRYGQMGHYIPWKEHYNLKTIHRLQQQLLSDILDNDDFVEHYLDPSEVYFICKVLQTRQYPLDLHQETIFLNKIKRIFLENPRYKEMNSI